ncbi:hypothetical protein ACFC25_20695 [Pseudarthrobacter sp. NPDC055928]|uniref:hypothetical protein n=1 Tax=Pseudarthrobacter sp. NPDC055928 TaxID=3345661 RepID=UPI0035E370FF
MGSYRVRRIGAAVVGGLVVSLALSGCGPQPEVEKTGAAAPSPAAVTTTSVVPVPAVSTTTAAPAPKETTAAAVAVSPAHKSFTFPDGHISFSYPEDWSVTTVSGGPGFEDPPGGAIEAVVSDGGGNDLLRVASGADGIGCTAGPADRTVLDRSAVPAMRDAEGTVPEFGFVVESIGEQDWYSMTVRQPRYLEEGETSSGCDILTMGNGASITSVIFNTPPEPAFAGREAARAWMATEQYAQLKAVMLSLAYA